jgi:hypothetical protein
MSEVSMSDAGGSEAPGRPSIVESIVAGLSMGEDGDETSERRADGATDYSQSVEDPDTFRTDVSGSLDSMDAMIEAAVEAEIEREDEAALAIQRTYRGECVCESFIILYVVCFPW